MRPPQFGIVGLISDFGAFIGADGDILAGDFMSPRVKWKRATQPSRLAAPILATAVTLAVL
jgi:hypothetical protein